MALETGTYISDLVVTNPAAADGLVDADNHFRLIKSTIKATFPNVTGAVSPTHTQLNYVAGVTSAIQTQLDALTTALALKAPLASPTFTGTPAAPTAAPGTNTTQVASTAFVTAAVAGVAVADNSITNAKLADMAAATIKGSIAGGDPADLTATQTTALLNNMVGDSGAGGTKGLVPAAAAGDAAASKFLKADGTWGTPAGGVTGTWTLIGTLLTTSGATQTQALGATYKEILFVGSTVSSGNAASFRVAISDDGTNFGTAITISPATGASGQSASFQGNILNSGVAATTKLVASLGLTSDASFGAFTGSEATENGIMHSVRFSPSSGNFDLGSIAIYGLN
jgi:hypothetical protein